MQKELRRNKHWLRDLLAACWHVLNFSRKAFVNLLFLGVLALIIIVIAGSQKPPVNINHNSILKLQIVGDVVEQKTYVDPYDQMLADATRQSNQPKEILLTDILEALNIAKNDDKIVALQLELHGLRNIGLSKLQEVGRAIEDFKETSGKSIIVYGDYFSQSQYYLAAHADRIILHPMGAVGLDGFGRYRMYYKSALEKLKINSHIFRVGTYKSAIEPYIRDDMSSQAKEANQLWLGNLWEMYKKDISSARGFGQDNFDERIEKFSQKFKQANGSFAQFALQNTWVDELMTHQQFEHFMYQEFRAQKSRYVGLQDYLTYHQQMPAIESTEKVAVVVAKGTIYDGTRPAGEIGGHSTAELLRDARKDPEVKAVVLRVDSPGGSAFASEIIRNEVLAIKEAGKPVVVSMSSMAASGGYWISASADEIWAAPTTITGSIGIFGMFMTFEDSLAELGITTDGVGTTDMAGLSPTRKLQPEMGDVIQTAIENGYQQFIGLVAKERNMSVEDVDKIAQGRVWSGRTAKELGLVDHLGYFDQAIESAAGLANLSEYDVEFVEKPLSPFDQAIQQMFSSFVADNAPEQTSLNKQSVIMQLWQNISKDIKQFSEFNDPMGMYIYCLECGTE